MRKLEIDKIIIVLGIIIVILEIHLTSCQPTLDPLREATFPCECIYKGYSHEIHFQCQEELYKFKDEDYYKKCNEGDILTKPLN